MKKLSIISAVDCRERAKLVDKKAKKALDDQRRRFLITELLGECLEINQSNILGAINVGLSFCDLHTQSISNYADVVNNQLIEILRARGYIIYCSKVFWDEEDFKTYWLAHQTKD